MTPTNFEINVALAMIAVTIVLFQWLRKSEAAHSTTRLKHMMRRFGLDPGLVSHGNPQIKTALNETRRRCGRCRVEGFCDRWLNGKAEGEKTFCPNARVFLLLGSDRSGSLRSGTRISP